MRSILKVNWDSNLPIYAISQSELQKKGIHSLLLDVDGTLVNRKSNIIPKPVKNWIRESKKLFSLYLISNNPSKKRIAQIAKELNLKYKCNASKPRRKVTLSAIKEIGSDPKNIAIIGDRIFTDSGIIFDFLFTRVPSTSSNKE